MKLLPIRRRLLRAAQRGVTLIEILIVLAIIGLIAGGAAVAVLPKFAEAKIKAAKTSMKVIQPVADRYRADHPGQCPTMEQLRADKELSAGTDINDPWGKPYKIVCADDEVYVVSSGPDAKESSNDDLKFPGQ